MIKAFRAFPGAPVFKKYDGDFWRSIYYRGQITGFVIRSDIPAADLFIFRAERLRAISNRLVERR